MSRSKKQHEPAVTTPSTPFWKISLIGIILAAMIYLAVFMVFNPSKAEAEELTVAPVAEVIEAVQEAEAQLEEPEEPEEPEEQGIRSRFKQGMSFIWDGEADGILASKAAETKELLDSLNARDASLVDAEQQVQAAKEFADQLVESTQTEYRSLQELKAKLVQCVTGTMAGGD